MTGFRRRQLLAGAAAGLLVVATPGQSSALTLDQARAQGVVGELPNGYVAARGNAPGVSALVDSVNRQRRQRYRQIAADTSVPMAAVEQQAGQALINRLRPGQWYMNTRNQWVQR